MDEMPEFRERGIAAVRLLQGVVYAEDESVWALLLENEIDLADYFCLIGLHLVIDRAEGLAYLKQLDEHELSGGYERLPKLFRKSPLGYEATILCVLLRDEYRRFEDEDLDNQRCVVSLDSLFELWESFFSSVSDEIQLRKSLAKSMNQLEKLKFVQAVKQSEDSWEIKKILKARVTVEQLEDLRNRLHNSNNSIDQDIDLLSDEETN
jgi:hypothetical protein